MSGSFYLKTIQALKRLENVVGFWITGRRFPPPVLCYVTSADFPVQNSSSLPKFDLGELMKEGFLWAVPKSRRTIERRMKRRFGDPDYHWKMHVPKTDLLTCNKCGHSYEAGCLCSNCYKRIQDETKAMQDAVQAELGLEPVDKEVVILYKGERDEQPKEFFEGKRIIELDKERPAWFSKNLLEKTTQPPSTSKDVKPTELA